MPTIVIAAGGTAGHVVPALAVADELRASGAEVIFVGTRERAEAELVPAAGYEIAFLSVARPRPPQPAARGLARARAGRRAVGGARGCCGASAPTRCSAAGGYVAGPVGLAAALRAHAAGADRGRQPPRPREPHARAVRAPGLPRVPDRRPRGRALPRHGPAGAARGLEADRDAARARLGIAGGRALPARLRRQPRRALASTTPRSRRSRDAGRRHRAARRRARATSPSWRRALGERGPAHYRLFEYLETLADPLAAADLVRRARRRLGVRDRGGRAGPRCSFPYPHATADHQDANARWMADAGAAVVIAGRRARPPTRLRARGRASCSATASGSRAMARGAPRALARPDAARARSRDGAAGAPPRGRAADGRRRTSAWRGSAAALRRASAGPA